MKTRVLAVLLTAALLAATTGCGRTEKTAGEPEAENGTPSSTSSSVLAGEPEAQGSTTPEQFQTSATLDETVLVDENGVKITATGLSYTPYSANLELTIENNSGENLSFTSGSLGYSCNSINGYMVDDGYLNCDVANGKKANEAIQFSSDALMLYGIDEIAEMEIGFAITDDDYNSTYTEPRALKTSAAGTMDDSADSYQASIANPASMDAYGYEMLYFGQDAAYDQNGVKLLSSGLMRNRDGETALLLELENTTGSAVYVSTSDIKINGLVVSSSTWSRSAINPGKRRVVEVVLSSVLDGGFWSSYGIDAIGSVSVSLEQSGEDGALLAPKTPVDVAVPGAAAAFDAEGTEVCNSSGLRVVYKTIQQDPSGLSDDLYLLLLAENHSGKTLTIGDLYDSLSVNDFMTDYSFYSQAMEDGESAALVVRLWGSALEENQITSVSDIQEVEMQFAIRDGSATLDEPAITITPNA